MNKVKARRMNVTEMIMLGWICRNVMKDKGNEEIRIIRSRSGGG